VRTNCPETITLVLTAHDRDAYLAGMLEAGAAGYLTKKEPQERLIEAIRRAAQGEFLFNGKQLARARHWRRRPFSNRHTTAFLHNIRSCRSRSRINRRSRRWSFAGANRLFVTGTCSLQFLNPPANFPICGQVQWLKAPRRAWPFRSTGAEKGPNDATTCRSRLNGRAWQNVAHDAPSGGDLAR